MKRRQLLVGTAALTLAQLTGGCGSKVTLKIQPLKSSVPIQLVSKFRSRLESHPELKILPQGQLKDLFALLQTWKQQSLSQTQGTSPNLADLVMIGDYWLTLAIRQNLIQPLDPAQLSRWQQLPEQWRKLVQRNNLGQLDPQGKVWAAPYRWGTTVIAYRADKFKELGWKPPTDWSDLWREELRGRISLLDSPREVIGLTLKKLGKSYNTQQLDKVPNLNAELARLHQQAKLYSSDSYLQPLLLGDTWVAVAWSADILPLLKAQQEIQAVVPQSGTALWTELWVQPAAAPSAALVQEWIDFCWQPQVATQLSLLTQASSPAIVGMKVEELPTALREDGLLLPDKGILNKSEFLLPLSEAAVEEYGALWRKIRSVGEA
ncbi:MAG: extracellular solute-binding protein [Actinomycetota bacterium]